MDSTLKKSLARGFALAALASLMTLMSAVGTQAQWTTSGTNTTTTNNVGVGTSTPSSTLEVQGPDGTLTLSQPGVPGKAVIQAAVGTDLHMSANARWTANFWSRNDASLPSWNFFLAPGAGADYAGLRRAAPSAGAFAWVDIMRFTNNGNVGIGTTSPATKLDVADSAYNGSTARFVQSNASASNGVYIQTQTASANDLALTVASNAGATIGLAVRNSGNVGIGTSAPGKKLEVLAADGEAARLYRSASSANWGVNITFALNNTNNSRIDYAGLHGLIANPAAGSENGNMVFTTATSGQLTEKMRLDSAGNVGIGTATPASKLHVVGDITVSGNINAKYQDVAEWVPSKQKLTAGTVVVLDTRNSNHVLASKTSYDARVAGVVSAQPGLTLGEAGEGKALVATTGRVKVKVDASRAPIQIGDLLVTSDVEGVAMKSEPVNVGGRRMHSPGTIIGKALEPLEKGTGEILVLLSLQ